MSTLSLRRILVIVAFILCGLFTAAVAQSTARKSLQPEPVLWRDPGDVRLRDLRYGAGSEAMAPKAPFTFIENVKGGASPKIKVKDARGSIWIVKLGEEAQSETVASRLVWALGYLVEEAYYFKQAEIRKLPIADHDDPQLPADGGVLEGVRFEPRRDGTERGKNWHWLENPFVGTRELDGLKVLMVLLANYDTRPENNRVLHRKHPVTGVLEHHYVVSDLGATLGRVGGLGGKRTKNTLEDFREGRFVVEIENGMVEFDYRTRPEGIGIFASIFNPIYHKSQANKEKAMRRIPIENARWIGSLLASLSDSQLRDAFHAARYDEPTTEGFISVLRARISQLTTL